VRGGKCEAQTDKGNDRFHDESLSRFFEICEVN
jgi:hypothetical protein